MEAQTAPMLALQLENRPTRLVAFDLETTGLQAGSDRIVEYCFIELDGDLNEVRRLEGRVNPEMPIPAEVTAIHGIRDEDVRGAPTLAEVGPAIREFVGEAVLVAHNHRFDLAFLSLDLERVGLPGLAPTHPCIDTMTVEQVVNSHKLEATFARYTGKPLEGAHGAAVDTQACITVLRAQLGGHGRLRDGGVAGLLHNSMQAERGREEKTWYDHAHKFYIGDGNKVHYAFGKHDGRPVLESDATYLDWVAGDTSTFPPETKRLARQFREKHPQTLEARRRAEAWKARQQAGGA